MQIEKLNLEQIPKNGVIKIFTAKGLDEREPRTPDPIEGSILTVYEYLEKRKDFEYIDLTSSHIEFSYELGYIELVLHEYEWITPKVKGQMIQTDVLKKLNINTGHGWECTTLAQFFRLNRTIFKSKEECMALITLLNSFEAKVKKETQTKTDNRANYDLVRRQVVQSNLPDAITIEIPIFKGLPKKMIEIEIDITPENLECVLISPDLADFIEDVAEKTINAELEKIKKLTPELPIIEK